MDCDGVLRNGLQRGLRDDEIFEMKDYVDDLAKRARAGKSAAELAKEARDLAQAKASYEKQKAVALARNVQLQLSIRHEAVTHVLETFRGMEAEGISAMQVGSKFNREGARLSVDARKQALHGQYMGGLVNDVKAAGDNVWKMFTQARNSREIAEALWTIDNKKAAPYTGSPEAMEIAKAVHKWSEKARLDANEAGTFTRKLSGYIVRQSHDPELMVKAGPDAWKAEIRDKLDWKKTADGKFDPAVDADKAERFLDQVYANLVTGVHFKAVNHVPNPMAQANVAGSVAASLSQERVLHFKDGGAWFDYNAKFGMGNLNESILAGFESQAKATALMRTFGPSPHANLQNIVGDVRKALARRVDTEGLKKLRNMERRLEIQMKELDGSMELPGNPTLARVGSNVRCIESMAKLGGAVISGLSDIPTFAFEFAYQGKGFFRSMVKGVSMALQGRGSLEQQRILSNLGVFYDSMTGSVAARFGGDGKPGRMQAVQNLFFKLNGLSLWTDVFKKSVSLMMSHDLAQDARFAWNALTPQRQRVLKLYGIDEGIWEMSRTGKMKAADGREYFTPAMASQIKEADIKNYVAAQGKEWGDGMAERFRADVEEKFRTYFRDRLQYGVLEPDARTRSIIYQGTKGGTPLGEALRCIMQFKSFSVVFMQRVMGREIYGRGADTMGRGLLQNFVPQNGERGLMPEVFAMTTLFGLGAMTVKALAAGRTPREFDDPKTWLAAMIQGGGLGIYGDYLFGEASRMGDSFLSSLAGPAMGSASSLVGLWQAFKDGQDVSSTAFRTLWSHLPGNNLFYAKLVLDQAICNGVYENLNPGYLRRMRRRITRETNQEFLWEPQSWW